MIRNLINKLSKKIVKKIRKNINNLIKKIRMIRKYLSFLNTRENGRRSVGFNFLSNISVLLF